MSKTLMEIFAEEGCVKAKSFDEKLDDVLLELSKRTTCDWEEDEGGMAWTGCGEQLGLPTEYGFKFCPFCGKELVKKVEEKEELCSECGHNLATEPHTCPYGEEINGDYSLCTCCKECEGKCGQEV